MTPVRSFYRVATQSHRASHAHANPTRVDRRSETLLRSRVNLYENKLIYLVVDVLPPLRAGLFQANSVGHTE